MTDPAGGAPPTPPPPEQPVTPPPAASTAPSWQTQAAAFRTAPVEPGPAPGITYADLMYRLFALFIDGVILGIVYWLLIIIAAAITIGTGGNLIITFLFGIGWAVLSAVYFVWTWTSMRASPGQKFLNLETVNAADGATLKQDQAIRRWAFLWGPFALSAIIPILGILIGLAAFVYALYLLYTVSQNPKHQGFHDVQASTVVVKRG